MIRSIELIPADREGLLLELDKPEDTGIVVKSVDGLGPAKATINTTALSLTDSAIFNGSRVGMRTITLTLLPLAVPTVERARHHIYNLLPIKQPVTIVVRTDTRTVKTLGYVESSEPDIFSSEEAVKVTLICPDGYWSDGAADTQNYLPFVQEHAAFEFDWEDTPLESSPTLMFSKTVGLPSVILENGGDVPAGFTIMIDILKDNATPISIYDDIRGQHLTLTTKWHPDAATSQPAKAGDRFYINTRVGHKSVTRIRDGKSEKALHLFDINSDWLMLYPGENRLYYTINVGGGAKVSLSRDILYQGV